VNVWAAAAAAATGVQVGAAMVATRFVVHETGPASLALLRYVIGFLCLLPPVLLSGQRMRFAARDVLPIAALGITQFGLLIAVLNIGLLYVPAGRAALIFATFPLQTLLLAAALGRERLTLAKTSGVLLTILGVGVALGEKALDRGAGEDAWFGELAVLASASLGALCSVFYRPYLQRYPVLPVSAFAMLASVGFLAILAIPEGFFAAAPQLSTTGWCAVVFIGFSSGIGYYLWLWALGHAAPTEATAFLSLSPVTAILLGGVLLAEPLSPALFAAATFLALGLWLANRAAAPKRLSVL
jgi:drug/metabolite transporter (DMT)-like permease